MTQIREAATVMVVRDAPDLHVFMLRRNPASEFVAGAYVFPGGAVDEEDRAPEMLARCVGRDDETASARLGVPSGGLGFWVAAIREAFEEAGVLFARERATGQPVTGGSEELDVARRAIGRHERGFLDFVEREDLLLDVGALHAYSNWVTPDGMPRRYDTWFFVAAAPEGHGYRHDDGETIASTWVRPHDALAAAQREEWSIIFPTQRHLEAIGRFDAADALLAVAATQTAVETVRPRLVRDGADIRPVLPGDPRYDAAPREIDGLEPAGLDGPGSEGGA